ncbi:histidine kinase, phosphotransfer Hpt [Cantharellus anzutake]|uniref:histidine kinase, phosphotransfer Hpt n=1 Tax=Cantharellus anzutake TaxID=1750568 RepID=UPI001907BC1B|nr:histidine kinase, phosphotransfer Hpt [Cantharellus anzutake]KAF8333528.1 histidine kinase, phosphotransfer Hpt [Cantharellus anzutake]
METFEQILEMDDDENHDFSWSIVLNYFDQAESTIKEMGSALEKEDLASLSRHGHFLKGSSAALGVKKVQESCERMQHYGKLRDEEKGVSITEKDALERIGKLIPQLKVDYAEAEKWLKEHYESY